MARNKHLINVHTSTGTTAPTGASLYLGEIAVQHTPNNPALWIKMGTAESSTQYEKFIGKTEITNMVSTASGLVESLSAVTLTGVTMNNSPVSVTDHVANLGTVITAETQLSTAKTGTGNVVGSISVSNHQITSNMFSAAPADALVALSAATTAHTANTTAHITSAERARWNNAWTSGVSAYTKVEQLSAGTISLVASSAASVYSSAVTYIDSAITGLDSSTAVTAGKYITGIAIADGKISGITEATLPSSPAITATTTGTGNVFTAVSTTGHSMTFTKGMTAAAKANLDSLSAATTAHTSNGDIHVTANQKTAWTNGANSGASAYTDVRNLSAVTLTGVTMNGSPVTVSNKVANLGTVITAETQLSTVVTGTGNVFSNIQVDNHKITMGKDVTALTGVTTNNTHAYLSATVASNSAITVGTKKTVIGDKTALSNVSATGSLVDAKAVKDYVADELTSAVNYKGATGATPSTAEIGDLYIASSDIAIPAAKSATGAAVTAETGDFIIARTTGTWDVIEKNLDGAITGSLTANTLMVGDGLHSAKSLANGTQGNVLVVGANGPQWTAGTLTDTATTLGGHYTPTGNTTGGTTATTNASAVKGIVYDGKGHITSVVTGSVLTTQTSLTTANGTTGNDAAAVVTGITTGGTAGHQLTLNKSNKIFSASTSDSALTAVSAITSWSAQTTILGPTYSYSGLPYVNSATSLADAYSALTDEMIKDEQVVATALNDLNVRVDEISAATGDNTELLEYIQENEEVVAGALNSLNERIGTVETHMTGDYIPITGYMTATGTTEEELTLTDEDTVNEALGKLQKQMLDNEESIAAGLNDLNTRLENVDDIIAHNTGITQLSGAVRSFSAATYYMFRDVQNMLNSKANDNEFRNLSAATVSMSNNLDSVSNTVTSNGRSTLTLKLNGVEQGKYTPSSGNTTIDLTAATNGSDVLLTGYELATGTTEEELAIAATDTVNEAFGKIQKQNYDNEAVIAGALNDLDERITTLEVSGSSGGDVEELSGAVVSKELVIAAALNDLNARIVELSGNTGGAETDPIFSSSVAARITQQDIDNWDAAAGGGSSDPNAITGITMNGNAVSVSNRVAALGTVVTAQTQLSKGTATGTGNVVTDINVSGHQITLVKSYSAAPADQFVTLSGATTGINATLTAHTNNGDIHVTAANKTTWNGKQDAISDLSEIRSNAASGMAAYNNVNALSAATTAHTGNNNIHVTAAQKTNWTNSGTSGANAYVGYIAHSANTGIHVTSTEKSTWNGKQNAISDLATIRSNAASGMVAYNNVNTLSAGTISELAKKSNTGHTHAISDITNLQTTLNGKSGTGHTHSNYATTGTVNTLNNTVTAHTANTAIHVTTAQTAAWDGKQDAINDLATIRSNAEAGAAKVSNVQSDWNATTGLAVILNKPTIPSAPGTLTTTATTAQSTATNEALTGNISLHKVSKTGSYNDLTNKPTIPAWATASTKPTYTASEVGALPTGTTLDGIADGTTRKLSNYATTGKVNTLSNTVTAHTADTTVHVTSTEKSTWNGKANTSDITITGLTVGGTNATVTNKVAAVPTASTSAFGVVKVPAQATSFLTNSNGTIGVATGTGANQVAVGSHTHTASQVGALPTGTTLDGIADGTTRKLSNYATTGNVNTLSSATQSIQSSAQTAYNSRITGGTITSGSTNSITTTNNRVAITAATLPSYSTANNDQVLMIKNGVPQWVTPSTITYSSSAPTGGNDGDIWIQTS